ncbi:HAD family phosphatase [uncultured Piscinibacter sp.]|uniref:HAD family hydrolase n=1 Tax=uncultured Piscinibacter sp. TaxID=1131835 RepID=UPI00261BF484|nr:HAD family phosphatase [uncultured Piscinibacter sp.]
MQGFLFDLDGTLIDSMPHHHDAWVAWHARRGMTLDADAFFAATAGRSNDEILSEMFPHATPGERVAMADEKETLYREFAAPRLAMVAGAQEFVERSLAEGLRLAVCTASTPENMKLAFARFPIDRWVETVVSPADKASGPSPGRRAGDGLRGKPHPDIFLEAARRLGLEPSRCIVFEDAPLGIEAARRAGMGAVALTTTLPAAAFAGYPNLLACAPDFRPLAPSALTKEDHHA